MGPSTRTSSVYKLMDELMEAQALAADANMCKLARARAFSKSAAGQPSSATDVLAATVTNVPSTATAADIAAFCKQKLDIFDRFLSVSMAPYKDGKTGRSTVYVASHGDYTRLLGLDGVRWRRETLNVKEAASVTRSACADILSR
ncbi:hypothetical protein SDRG_12034 [Saprolegnia diclina VS20]|uniref:Uncharacterized protein n=1 Tax=Saprolegnia diclina (strain VS20) TaxID=1156394 RepID=T0RJU6_SAPDV|nr:hypothetical protein SDRG_12034 [Saprolegnia diclina VS20]EQC30182.1 hypothetical protein SDRG_12034 [Saprolegnia diclina VS20]|eukprot:XP_008616314.1 hypothetical protein SDRG_12034 [Saprolegnia diclina VS20]